MLLGVQVRAEWLGLGVGVLVWGLLTHRLGRVAAIGMAGLGMIGMVELAGVELGARGGEISFGAIVGRVIAPINLELAKEFTPNADIHAGTMEWRERWWEQIWLSVHSKPMLEAFGHGYGFDLFGLAPTTYELARPRISERRTASSITPSATRDGSGSLCSAVLQFTILRLLWRAFRAERTAGGAGLLGHGHVDGLLRAKLRDPVSGNSVLPAVGMAMAPAVQSREICMRVLHVHNFYQLPGGEDQSFAATGAMLEDLGHEVIRFTLQNDVIADIGRLTRQAKPCGTPQCTEIWVG